MQSGVDLAALTKMNQAQLDQLFASSPAGPVPSGEGQGTVLFDPGGPLEDVAARVAHQLFWQGKVFDPATGELRNLVLPFGIPAIVAKVYLAPSWIDGKDSVVLDYSQTSIVAHWVRDEIREVAPNLYLGVVFWDHRKILNFALKFGG